MKALIIEDESVAAQQLQRLLKQANPDIEILSVLQSIEESVEWFETHPSPELVFMDIHLADGSSFRIFDQVKVDAPIIFTTAYDQYALEAFKVNSVDYLLKPINPDHLQRALTKVEKIRHNTTSHNPMQPNLDQLLAMMKGQCQQYPSCFLIPQGDRLVPLAVKDIAYIYLDNKIAQCVTFDGKKQSIDKPLDAIMEQLDPRQFYRVNRQFAVAHNSIKEITFWLLGKLKLTLTVETPDAVVVPKAKVPEFKLWYASRG